MATTRATSVASARGTLALSLLVLGLGLTPWPEGWSGVHAVMSSVRSPELNRAEREVQTAGYYEGLIGGRDGPEGARGELALRLMGKPSGWVRFSDANVSRHMPADFLQFELLPEVRQTLFGQLFATNAHGMHSPEVALAKPEGTFRIALLGASMDMGWGVNCHETYSFQLEQWLNQRARRTGRYAGRRFEVLNFAVAAYSPIQRLETFRRKVAPFSPDMVIYSATLLDLRLMEIHLCDMMRNGADLTYDFVKSTLAEAGVGPAEMAVDGAARLLHKEQIKARLRPRYWDLYDATLGALAGECRVAGIPLAVVIVPRVGKADNPRARKEPVARLKAVAAHHALPVFDLMDTFDRFDPARLEIAAWDDHPNALGHHRLFLALARAIVRDRECYDHLFPPLSGQEHAARTPAAPPSWQAAGQTPQQTE